MSFQVGLEMSRSRGMEEVSMSLLHSRGLDPQELYPAYSQSDAFSISSHGSHYGFRKVCGAKQLNFHAFSTVQFFKHNQTKHEHSLLSDTKFPRKVTL